MATTASVQLSIAAGGTPGAVIITLYGGLGVADVARLQCVLDGLLHDNASLAIALDLHQVQGETSGISGLAAAATGAAHRGGALTLCNPSESLRQALESGGLAGLIRMLQRDRRPPWSVGGTGGTDRQPWNHPSGQFPAVEATVLGSADNA